MSRYAVTLHKVDAERFLITASCLVEVEADCPGSAEEIAEKSDHSAYDWIDENDRPVVFGLMPGNVVAGGSYKIGEARD